MRQLSIIISVFLLGTISGAQQRTYFVSPSGNDSANGTSVSTSWKSIEKVNSMIFQPGDKILFESGATFYGQLVPKGSGKEGMPIEISSFGGHERPVIDFGDAEGAGILLENVSYWEIKGMEITSRAPHRIGTGRQGIAVTASGQGHNLKHFVIKDNYIHDIWGQLGGRGVHLGYYSSAILVRILRDRKAWDDPSYVKSTIDDVLIESNNIERVDKCGIVCWGAKENVVVRGNRMDNLGGDGIFVNGPYRGLIERNVIRRSCMRSGDTGLPGDDGWWPHVAACWIQNTEETIMQFNEVYDTGRNLHNGDGFAYDFDFNCKRCIAQYNYSQNNHGFMLLMYNIFENITRYNISENDHTHLIQMQGSRERDRNIFYNNVFYLDYGMADLDFFLTRKPEELGAKFYNNIFYASGQGRFRICYTSGDSAVRKYDEDLKPDIPSGSIFLHNCYFGPWKNGIPDDPEALIADPLFVAPGRGGDGLSSLKGYALRPESPCINTGLYMPFNGGRDFFGNNLDDGHPDLGAFEYVGSGAFADSIKLQISDTYATQASSIAWARWMFPEIIESDDSEKGLVIYLREPLPDDIQGSLTWTGTTETIFLDISRLKDRQTILFPANTTKEELEGSIVSVSLANGAFREDFVIPVKNSENKKR